MPGMIEGAVILTVLLPSGQGIPSQPYAVIGPMKSHDLRPAGLASLA